MPLSNLELWLLCWKTALLLSIVLSKRVSKLNVLSFDAVCLWFGGGYWMVQLLPRPAFHPKVLAKNFVWCWRLCIICHTYQNKMRGFTAFSPLRALRLNVDCTFAQTLFKMEKWHWASLCQSNVLPIGQLLSSFSPVSMHSWFPLQELWHSLQVGWPLHLHFICGAHLEDVCNAAGWASSSTFAI